jgi:glutamine amidotransferase
MKVAIIDYGMGNLRSVYRGLEYGGAEPVITTNRNIIKDSDAVVLPGVGAFSDAISGLKGFQKLLRECIEEKPLLGICLGLQLYFTESEEEGLHKGLDLMKGRVVRLPSSVKIPHMGWNSIKIKKESRFLEGIKDGDFFYFVHSFYAKPEEDVTLAATEYGVEIPAILEKGNIYATQFHPEKSGKAGLRLLKNFIEIAKST